MGRIDMSQRWTAAFAAGLWIRPLLILPMVSSGPLRDSSLAIFALSQLFLFHLVLGVAVLRGGRLALAFGILTTLIGPGLAGLGHLTGMPAPWPLVMGVYNLALALVGVGAWRKPRDLAAQ